MLEDQRAEAQQALDELFSERLLPFKLSAQSVELVGFEDYIVLFHDSRLYSVDVVWHEGESFKDAFRTALLDLLERRRGHRRKGQGSQGLSEWR